MLMTLPVRAGALGLECVDCSEVIVVGQFTLVDGMQRIEGHCRKRHTRQVGDAFDLVVASHAAVVTEGSEHP